MANKLIITRLWNSTPMRLAVNIALCYIAYYLCRIAFLLENLSEFPGITFGELLPMFAGGFRFDSSAIFYTNSLFILLYLIPIHVKESSKTYQAILKWLFVIVNTICVVINLGDSAFFTYRHQRSTISTFSEFQGEGNIAKITGIEMINHWYFLLLTALIVFMLIKLYRRPVEACRPLWRYYVGNILTLLVTTYFAVSGMRGNMLFLSATRPISVGYAQRYVDNPVETGIVLNTPFSIYRTINQTTIPTPDYFASEAELAKVYSPVHMPADSLMVRNKNVVILIVESFATEFIGGLNKDLDNGTYKGYTPFVDSMLDSCMYFEQMFDNTGFSIDAPPAVFSSIPRASRPFVLSPHSLNDINSIASLLKERGYTSAFFHGADNESLGFSAFVRHAGFDRYYGQNEFYADSRFGGKSEFDGWWGVWDEPFLQFFCSKLGELPQPFIGSVFTLSSHHPFKVPDKYTDRFVDEGIHKLHKCIRYTDYSIERFFEEARKQPWFDNTIFVLCADHSSAKRTHDVYKTLLEFKVPVLFYDPSGEMPRGCQPGIAQQTDIMPTVLSYLGYDKPYVAFGKDLLTTPAEETWAFHWSTSGPIYVKGDYVLTFDTEKVTGLYNYKKDPLLKHDLKGSGLPEEADMELHIKAMIQSYLSRMNTNNVTASPAK